MSKYTTHHFKTSRFKITSHKDQSILFEGLFPSFKACIESAVKQGRALHHADLRHINLSNANLDDADLYKADFTGANLNGTNLSESNLAHCNFTDSSLIDCCLAYSNMKACCFEGAEFGASNIVGATLSNARFAGRSCFSLNFIEADCLKGCLYKDSDGECYSITQPPVVIMGLDVAPLVFMDNNIKLGDITEKR